MKIFIITTFIKNRVVTSDTKWVALNIFFKLLLSNNNIIMVQAHPKSFSFNTVETTVGILDSRIDLNRNRWSVTSSNRSTNEVDWLRDLRYYIITPKSTKYPWSLDYLLKLEK